MEEMFRPGSVSGKRRCVFMSAANRQINVGDDELPRQGRQQIALANKERMRAFIAKRTFVMPFRGRVYLLPVDSATLNWSFYNGNLRQCSRRMYHACGELTLMLWQYALLVNWFRRFQTTPINLATVPSCAWNQACEVVNIKYVIYWRACRLPIHTDRSRCIRIHKRRQNIQKHLNKSDYK